MPGWARSARAWGLVVPLLFVAAVVFAVVVVTTEDDDATVTGPQLSVAEVAADPDAYEGRQVVLRGSVAEVPANVPEGSEGAFVLTDAGGARLLVVPSRRERSADLREDATVHVSGVVTALGPEADNRRREPAPFTLGDLAGATGTDAIVRAVEVAPA